MYHRINKYFLNRFETKELNDIIMLEILLIRHNIQEFKISAFSRGVYVTGLHK